MARPKKEQHGYLVQPSKRSSVSPSPTESNNANDVEDQSSSNDDIIRCVCDDSSDDGFMIQCELCDEWQHGHCVNIRKSNVPDHYYCYQCCRNYDSHTRKHKRRKKASNGTLDINRKGKKALAKHAKDSSNSNSNDSSSDEGDKHARNTRNDRSLPGSTAVKRKKKFISLRSNIFKEKLVEDLLVEVHRQWMESNKQPKSDANRSPPAKGLNSIVVMESNLLRPAIPKASIRPLRKSLRGSYFQQNKQQDPQASLLKGIFADIHIPEKRFLMEVTGELMRKSEYKKNADNQFDLLGTPLSRVFFYQALDICIDARFAGNDSRYIRRSCCPNSEIKSIILPNDSDDRTIHMGIYTSEEVDRGEELTIGWNWHKGVLMWKKNKEFLKGNYEVKIDKSERKTIRKILDFIDSEFGECACEDKDECLIESLKVRLEEIEGDADDTADEQESKVNPVKKEKAKKFSAFSANTIKKHQQKSTQRLLKKSTPPIARKSPIKSRQTTIAIKKETYTPDIFSSDDGLDSSTPTTSATAIITTASMVDTMEGVISDSPLTSLSHSYSDVEVKEDRDAADVIGDTRIQHGMVRLPSKKRWLLQYINYQRRAEASTLQRPQSFDASTDIPTNVLNAPDTTTIPPTENSNIIISDVGELSDGTSSESTLPLEYTPTTRHLDFDTKQPHNNTTATATTAATSIPTDSANNVNTTTHISSLITTTTNDNSTAANTSSILEQESVATESVSIAVKDHNHTLTNNQDPPATSTHLPTVVKQPPRKLTLQEYLSLRQSKISTATSNADDKQPTSNH